MKQAKVDIEALAQTASPLGVIFKTKYLADRFIMGGACQNADL